MQITVNLKTHASVAALPDWLAGKAIGQWVPIPNTGMDSLDLTAINAAGLNPGDWSYGEPHKGRFAYSGGTVRAGSKMLLFGGGGANAWAGNEWWQLDLLLNAPRWVLLVPPTPASKVWPKGAGQTSHAYMQDGTPNARHSYWTPQCIDATDDLMVFGAVDVWETDSGRFLNVDSYHVGSGAWRPAGSHPDMPHQRQYDGNWMVKHPVTEDVYVCLGPVLSKWQRASNTFVDIGPVDVGMDAGFAALDPNTNKILRIGRLIANQPCQRIDCVTGAVVPGNLVGPYASVVDLSDFAHFNGSGFVYDLGLKAYLLFQNVGQILKLTPSGNDWNVDLFATTGAPPPSRSDMAPGSGLWGRFAYIPVLKGVCLVTPGANSPYSQPAFFVKTSS